MDTVHTRLSHFLEEMSLSKHALAQKLGISASAVGYLIGSGGRQSKPSGEVLERIAKEFPQLSLNWLIAGIGPMLLESAQQVEESPCWQLLQAETTRRQQLQADYDVLLANLQKQQAGR